MNKKIVYGALWVVGCWLIGCTIFFTTSIYTRWFDTTIRNTPSQAIIWSKATTNNGSSIDTTVKQTDVCKIDTISLYTQNSIPVHVYYPVDAEQQAPVVIFSHGYATDCSVYTFIINDLVAHGYVVIGIDHPGIAKKVVLPNGEKIVYQKPIFADAQDKKNKTCMALDQYITNIDQVYNQVKEWSEQADHILYNRINMQNCIVMGHSLGGAASMAYGHYNKNISGSISLDGFYAPWNTTKTNTIPCLYLSAEPKRTTQQARLAAVQAQTIQNNISLQIVPGADHNAFCDAILWNKVKRWWYATVVPVGNITAEIGVPVITNHIREFIAQVCANK